MEINLSDKFWDLSSLPSGAYKLVIKYKPSPELIGFFDMFNFENLPEYKLSAEYCTVDVTSDDVDVKIAPEVIRK